MNRLIGKGILITLFVLLNLPAYCQIEKADLKKIQTLSIDSLYSLGRKEEQNNNYDNAIIYFATALEKLNCNYDLTTKEKKTKAVLMNALGAFYCIYAFDYLKGYSFIQNAIIISKKENFYDVLGNAYNNLGAIYLLCNQVNLESIFIEDIWENLNNAFYFSSKAKDWDNAISPIVNTCILMIDSPKEDKFREFIEIVKSFDIPSGTLYYEYAMHMVKAVEEMLMGEYENSILNIHKAIVSLGDKADPDFSPTYYVTALTSLSDILIKQKKYEPALETIQKALDESKVYYLKNDEVNLLHKMYEVESLRGNSFKSEQLLLKYYILRDSLLNIKELSSLITSPLLNEIELMEETVRETENRKKMFQTIGLIIGGVALLVIVFFIILYFNHLKLNEYSRRIYEKYVSLLETNEERKDSNENEALNNDSTSNLLIEEKSKSNFISEEDAVEVMKKINVILEDTSIVCDSSFSLQKLSELSGLSYKIVSHVINERMKKNFNSIVNDIRIREACRRMKDTDNYGNYTVAYIAQSVGIKSRSNFTTIFKSIVGITPSDFMKNIRKDRDL